MEMITEEDMEFLKKAEQIADRYIYLTKLTGQVSSDISSWIVAGKPNNLGNLKTLNLWETYKINLKRYLALHGIKVLEYSKKVIFSL